MNFTTTETWAINYLKRIVLFAENEASNFGFTPILGRKLTSFILYDTMHNIDINVFQKHFNSIIASYCDKNEEALKNLFSLHLMIAANCMQFYAYVKNTQADKFIRTHYFIDAWKHNDQEKTLIL